MISFSVKLRVVFIFSAFFVVKGTLTPNGTVPLDCGSQQTFTCNVTGGAAQWTISGLSGENITRESGQDIAKNNARITTTDTSGLTQSSTITIIEFTTSDNGGTIRCINQADSNVQGMASISVEPPSCPASFSANRDGDFTNATVTYELATPPPVVSTTVTYCRTLSSSSSPICGNMSCLPSNGTCTISGLDPCVNYSLSAIPNNKCDSATGCRSMVVPPKGHPSCPTMVDVTNSSRSESHNDPFRCDVSLIWEQPTDTSPVTSTTVTYCPTSSSSSPNCGNMTCTSPCTIRGLLHSTEYNFKVIPSNNCGSATGCTRNNATANLLGNCDIEKPRTSSTGVSRLVLLVLLVLLLIPLLSYPIGVLIVQRCCYEDKSYCEVFWCCWCCGCCAKGKSGRNSTEPMKSPTGDNDAQDKTGQKEEKLTYAALEFSEQAGSTGEKKIRSQEEPVQYAAVDQA